MYSLPVLDLHFQLSIPNTSLFRKLFSTSSISLSSSAFSASSSSYSNKSRCKRSDSLPDSVLANSTAPLCGSCPTTSLCAPSRWEEPEPAVNRLFLSGAFDSHIYQFPCSIPVITSPTGEFEVDEEEVELLKRSKELGKTLPADCSVEGFFTVHFARGLADDRRILRCFAPAAFFMTFSGESGKHCFSPSLSLCFARVCLYYRK